MAFGRLMTWLRGEPQAASPNITDISLNPDDTLSQSGLDLLRDLLLAEEKKPKRAFKQKKWESGALYPHPSKDGEFVRLVGGALNRRPKRYGAVIVLGSDEEMPDKNTRKLEKEQTGISAIYLKKFHDGHVEVCAGKKDSKKLEPAQVAALDALSIDWKIAQELKKLEPWHESLSHLSESEKKQKIKERRKKISQIQEICGYKYFVYTVANKIVGAGAFGEVACASKKYFFVEGKLKRSYRPQDLVTKTIKTKNQAIRLTESELALLQNIPGLRKKLGTKEGATIQKDATGAIESITFTQRRAKGSELFSQLFVLNNKHRIQAIPLILKALDEDHNNGIVYRDIKSENIFVKIDVATDDVTSVTLLDYGCAQRISAEVRALAGTPDYMSPEMVAENKGGVENDGYSVGVVIREILKDAVFLQRAECLKKDVYPYLEAEHYLNISMRKPILDGIKQKATAQETQDINLMGAIAHEMTATASHDRLSVKGALHKLGVPGYEAEVKEESKTPQYNYDQGLASLEALEDRKNKWLFLNEVFEQLQKYQKSLDQKSEAALFLGQCIAMCFEDKEGTKLRTLSEEVVPTVAALLSRALYQQKYLSNDSEFPARKAQILHQLEKALVHGYKAKESVKALSAYWMDAWNETYCRNMSAEDRKKSTFSDHFMGWPAGKGGGTIVSYIAGGFVLTFIKNIIKLVEFFVKGCAESVHCIFDNIANTQPTSFVGKGLKGIGWLLAGGSYLGSALAGWIVSTVTSPMANAQAGLEHPEKRAIGGLSVLVSATVYGGFVIVAAPLVLTVISIVQVAVVAGGLALRAGLAAFLEKHFGAKPNVSEKKEPGPDSETKNQEKSPGTTARLSKSLNYQINRETGVLDLTVKVVPPSEQKSPDSLPALQPGWVPRMKHGRRC